MDKGTTLERGRAARSDHKSGAAAPGCGGHFETIEAVRQARLEFHGTYNTTWLIERHGYLTPEQFYQKQLPSVATAA